MPFSGKIVVVTVSSFGVAFSVDDFLVGIFVSEIINY